MSLEAAPLAELLLAKRALKLLDMQVDILNMSVEVLPFVHTRTNWTSNLRKATMTE